MALVGSLFFNVPVEVQQIVLAYLLPVDQANAECVCKHWSPLVESILWKPIYSQLNPIVVTPVDEVRKPAVLADLQQNAKRIGEILNLVNTDEELASILGPSSISLQTLKQMHPLARSFHMMRLLRRDCTPLFECLVKKYRTGLAHIYMQVATDGCSTKQYEDARDKYCKDDKTLPLLLELLEARLGRFNAAKTMSIVLPMYYKKVAIEHAIQICASIVQSHHDLTAFFDSKIQIRAGRWEPATPVVKHILIPEIQKLGLNVTKEDWIQCNYPNPDEL